MKALLDTHAFLWWVTEHPSLSPKARDLLGGGAEAVYLSAVVGWEIAIKKRLKRLEVPDDLQEFFDHQIEINDLTVLPVQLAHALRVYELPDIPGHKDPFDRLLVAQALAEDMALLSADEALDGYGVERIW
jgi:PIN domain nuclease of toxin-antitoxin system